MPFVPDDIERREPPPKRRKLLEYSDMARRQGDDLTENRWRTDPSALQRADEKMEDGSSGQSQKCIRTSSREELIECIKRGQKPTWVPPPGFQALCDEEEALNAQKTPRLSQPAGVRGMTQTENDTTKHHPQTLPIPGSEVQERPIERPRSALHRGDFSENGLNSADDFWSDPGYQPGLAISTHDIIERPPSQWFSEESLRNPFVATSHPRAALGQLNTSLAGRRRAPSLGSSLSSSFVMRAPTSPLVHATSNPDLEMPTGDVGPEQPRLRRDSMRRRTMPPNSFHSFTMTPIDATPPNFSRPLTPALRREISLPSHTHRSQRSLSSFTYHPRSNPQSPLLRSRGPSMTSENGSRRRTSMVGSFEESILRGRMSTPPSKPLDFVAQIGVMGKGECPANLKCPAHVSVPFPAVFYSYPASTGTRSVADDTPSPYVGTINLDRNLKPITLATKKNKKDTSSQKRPIDRLEGLKDLDVSDGALDPKLHVGGAYRIPQQGQLQIVIKNPNKTAVKLFLVPYNLDGMEAGSKTFVRQRSYSTGSIIENALGGETTTTQAIDPLENKHILRYLIHLKFCCPAKNRFYLYDDIRVVFANRVPDGKEKLRNEVQLPEPKYSTWKPARPETTTKPSKSAPSTPIVEAFEFESPQFFGHMDGFLPTESPTSPTPSERRTVRTPPFEFPAMRARPNSPVWSTKERSPDAEKAAFEFPDTKAMHNVATRPERALSPITGFAPTTPLPGSPIPWRSPSGGTHSNRSFSPVPELRDSLLSRQLRELTGLSNSTKEVTSESSEMEKDKVD